MNRIPLLSGEKVLKALKRMGYYVRDQKGSHIHLRHPMKRPITVPNHDPVARGTLRAILKDAEITVEEFLKHV
jgi:predicted RNA binding protein YcfA (HicA-like mRNA interferase family)